MPVPHRARKWWCDAHRDQAAEGDLDDWRAPRIIFTGGGWKVALTSADKAYYAELDRDLPGEVRAARARDARPLRAEREGELLSGLTGADPFYAEQVQRRAEKAWKAEDLSGSPSTMPSHLREPDDRRWREREGPLDLHGPARTSRSPSTATDI